MKRCSALVRGTFRAAGCLARPATSLLPPTVTPFFAHCETVQVGDTIDLTSPQGTYHYRVDWTRVVASAETKALDPTPQAALTLVNCYPFSYIGPAPDRFVVRASMSEDEPIPQPSPSYGLVGDHHNKSSRREIRARKSALRRLLHLFIRR